MLTNVKYCDVGYENPTMILSLSEMNKYINRWLSKIAKITKKKKENYVQLRTGKGLMDYISFVS